METLKYILISLLFLALSSCEKNIDFNHGDTLIEGVTINALAVGDTVFIASISKAYPFYRMNGGRSLLDL